MPHMRIEVCQGPWIVIDGPYGSECIPCDVCGSLPDYLTTVADCPEDLDPDEHYTNVAFRQVKDYCENVECYSIEQLNGFCARLSASGYIDCTEWQGPYTTPETARRRVVELFDLCPACEESAEGPKGENPACNFYHY